MNTYFVPGRANIIGEHVDYSLGKSLPFALDLGVTVRVRPRHDLGAWIHAGAFGSGPLDETNDAQAPHFLALARAVYARFPKPGVDLEVTSTLPAGAGMSSSAAFASALLLALGGGDGLLSTAHVVQAVEAEAGSAVGLLDPLACLGARTSSALRIDFATHDVDDIPLPAEWRWSAIDTGVGHSLHDSDYASRRRECEELERQLGPLRQLREDDIASVHDEVLRRRARHVLRENQRVDRMLVAITSNDVNEAGRILNESHHSLSRDYEVSLPAVDHLCEAVQHLPGVAGARMMGGGFGGVLLVLHRRPIAWSATRTWSLVPSAGAFERAGMQR